MVFTFLRERIWGFVIKKALHVFMQGFSVKN